MSESWHEGGVINQAPATAWDKAQGLVKFEVYHWTLPVGTAKGDTGQFESWDADGDDEGGDEE